MTSASVSLGNQDVIRILSFLDKSDLITCSKVSSEWRRLASDNSLWSRFYPGVSPKPGFPLKEHLYITSQMFPISKFPEIWEKIVGDSTPNSSTFDETKADFVDSLSEDDMVTVEENQVWDLIQVTDNKTIEYKIRNPRRFGRGCTIQ